MTMLDLFTAANMTAAQALRSRPADDEQTLWAWVPDLLPGAVLHRGFTRSRGAAAALLHHPDDDGWALLPISYPRHGSGFVPWARLDHKARADLLFAAFLSRVEAPTLTALLERLLDNAAFVDRLVDMGETEARTVAMILTSDHPDAAAARTLWGLGGFPVTEAIPERHQRYLLSPHGLLAFPDGPTSAPTILRANAPTNAQTDASGSPAAP